jgi:excisionase family DNA binding protein
MFPSGTEDHLLDAKNHQEGNHMNLSSDQDQSLLLFFTVSEVACRLRVTDSSVYRWIRAGALQALMIARPHRRHRFYLIRRATIEALLGS